MKYYLILASFFVLACNTKENKLKQQLTDLEIQLPQAEKDLKEAKKKQFSLLELGRDRDRQQRRVFMDSLRHSDAYKQLRIGYKEDRVDSIKKAIADTKEKIMLAK